MLVKAKCASAYKGRRNLFKMWFWSIHINTHFSEVWRENYQPRSLETEGFILLLPLVYCVTLSILFPVSGSQFFPFEKQGIWISWVGRSVQLYPSDSMISIHTIPHSSLSPHKTLVHGFAYFRFLINVFWIGVNWNLASLSLVQRNKDLADIENN